MIHWCNDTVSELKDGNQLEPVLQRITKGLNKQPPKSTHDRKGRKGRTQQKRTKENREGREKQYEDTFGDKEWQKIESMIEG